MSALGPFPQAARLAPVALGNDAAPLVLRSRDGGIMGRQAIDIVPASTATALPQTMADLLARGSGKDARVVGLMPFRADLPAYAYANLTACDGAASRRPSRPLGPLTVRPEPSDATYLAAVRSAVEAIARGGDLRKVVLARSLVVASSETLPAETLLERLGEDSAVLTFCVPLPALPHAPRTLVGATPELLVRKEGRRVLSAPLAGSAPRHPDPALDGERRAALLRSDKDLREHRAVVEAVLDTLAPYCSSLAASEPALVSTATMWHLGTRIEGTLRGDNVTAAELAVALHPTPAVCGTPREAARDLIAALEPVERSFFAGALGWSTADGDGEWHVVIRCAEISGKTARLFAGAGIVDGSDPASELAETAAKFRTLLRALGIEDGE